ncbi:preprotein translocase subunit SecA, partial [SAR202 cluster bacterium AC-409-J13_OGT_754m]|nr:preprotein translocase subunit SecA [SAR202 cluster bacterium AC-409-J13_OGT_754m]
MVKIFEKWLGAKEDRTEKKYRVRVQRINDLESEFEDLTDQQLSAKTEEFRRKLNDNVPVESVLEEAFATVREASKRTLNQRHFDVQLIGGIVLHEGNIAEMRTGEGKTLVATLPSYLNSIAGHGVHVVTVNDYLARRDPVWMGPIYEILGLSVACLQHDKAYIYDSSFKSGDPSLKFLRPATRKEAYKSDIVYGTNNEFGFDYLRDNMVVDLEQQVQRDLHYAIVDEVDNILIDEARTPLIISGPAQDPVELYGTMARVVPRLIFEEDYVVVDERSRALSLTETGIGKVESSIKVDNLYDPENMHLVQYVENALRAHALFRKDREYVVKGGEVVIVDEFTGRLQPGRRWSDGLHQAIEAKEGLKIQQESVTYATITLQNYFRMYSKMAGMTGTAATESEEFMKIYGLDVVVIPTNTPMVRNDLNDLVYIEEAAKWKAVVEEIADLHGNRKPVLVGTTSIENTEKLSDMLKRKGVQHKVLNAKQHEQEALIISQAGRPGAVTVATNMAGRGTDIVLGGNPTDTELNNTDWVDDHEFVVKNGGLNVIGTEHHEARRIDNQLRGRSGRQGDSGTTRFYVSLEDDVVKRFGGERAKDMMTKVSGWAGVDQGSPIESGMISKLISNAQSRVEGFHFESRKHLLEFDDVLNQQREQIYAERHKILDGSQLRTIILQMIVDEIDRNIKVYLKADEPDDWDIEPFITGILKISDAFGQTINANDVSLLSREEILERLKVATEELYQEREDRFGLVVIRKLEQLVMLRSLDMCWVQHLTSIER